MTIVVSVCTAASARSARRAVTFLSTAAALFVRRAATTRMSACAAAIGSVGGVGKQASCACVRRRRACRRMCVTIVVSMYTAASARSALFVRRAATTRMRACAAAIGSVSAVEKQASCVCVTK